MTMMAILPDAFAASVRLARRFKIGPNQHCRASIRVSGKSACPLGTFRFIIWLLRVWRGTNGARSSWLQASSRLPFLPRRAGASAHTPTGKDLGVVRGFFSACGVIQHAQKTRTGDLHGQSERPEPPASP
jgi:hypothetical protein